MKSKLKLLMVAVSGLMALSPVLSAAPVVKKVPRQSAEGSEYRVVSLGVLSTSYFEKDCAPTTYRREQSCEQEQVCENVPTSRQECHAERDCGYRMMPRFGCETHFGKLMDCGLHTEMRWACDTFTHQECKTVPDSRRECRYVNRCRDQEIPVPSQCKLVEQADSIKKSVVIAFPSAALQPEVSRREEVSAELVSNDLNEPILMLKVKSQSRKYAIESIGREEDNGVLNVILKIDGACNEKKLCVSELESSR